MVTQYSLPLAGGSDTQPRPYVRELAMSAAWNGGLTRALTSVNGEPLTVVFRGLWSHGFGPDFAGAMIQVGSGAPETGDVEIHVRSSDWVHHGHHLDPHYNSVILHVVARLDAAETRREDGSLVPTVVLDIPDADLFAIDQELPEIWANLGKSVCAEGLATREPARIRAALLRLGDQRFSERVAAFEGELTADPLPLVYLRGIFDAFGYTQNREPMRSLATAVIDSSAIKRIVAASQESRWVTTHAVLFGISGFLPLSPIDAHHAGLDGDQIAAIEHEWRTLAPLLGDYAMPATSWTRARTRPANHPAARLTSLANLLVATRGDPSMPLLESALAGDNLAARLRDLTNSGTSVHIGESRAVAITASVVCPVLMAYARHTDDPELEDALSRAWASLPRSEWSRPAKRALGQAVGDIPLGQLGERAIQGLLHLDRALCAPRRCYECPIAAEVVRDLQRQRASEPTIVQSMLPT